MRLQVPIVPRIARRRLPGERLRPGETVDVHGDRLGVALACELADRADLALPFIFCGLSAAGAARRLLELAETVGPPTFTRGRA